MATNGDAPLVIYDACVFYSASLRDVLLEVAIEGLFHARWTAQIHEEWMRNLQKNRSDLRADAIARTRRLIDSAIPDCLVTGHEGLIDRLQLPDPDDRHVLAAAVTAEANVIVTFNVKDFPESTLKPHGIEAQDPDDFLAVQFDRGLVEICRAIRRLRLRLARPPMDTKTYLKNLTNQRLPKFAKKLQTVEHWL